MKDSAKAKIGNRRVDVIVKVHKSKPSPPQRMIVQVHESKPSPPQRMIAKVHESEPGLGFGRSQMAQGICSQLQRRLRDTLDEIEKYRELFSRRKLAEAENAILLAVNALQKSADAVGVSARAQSAKGPRRESTNKHHRSPINRND